MKYILLLLLTINLYGEHILGRVDKVDFPEFALYNIKAKIDTGAKTSSLHCTEILPLANNLVQFTILNSQNEKLISKPIIKPIVRTSYVKSSNGLSQKRYFIHTTVMVYNKPYEIELSLSFRNNMIYPLLLGRELLNQGFVVDTSKKYLSYQEKMKQ